MSLTTECFVTKDVCDTLLSYQYCTIVGLFCINLRLTTNSSSVEEILAKFSDRITGIGKLKGVQVKLHVEESVAPSAQPHRRLTFHFRKRTELELDKLLDLDIIERVDDVPTPCVSPIIVIENPKHPEQICICVDMRAPNRAILRERHDIVADLPYFQN